MQKGRHHGSLPQALTTAAFAILDTVGVEGVTIRATARAAGVSHAAPANHFPDRRALLTAVAIHCFEDMIAQAEAARTAAPPAPAARILAFANAYVAYGLAHPNRYRMMWRMDMLDNRDPALTAITDGLYATVENDVIALPGLSAEAAATMLVALASLVHGYVAMRIDGNFVAADDEATGMPRHLAIIEALIGPS